MLLLHELVDGSGQGGEAEAEPDVSDADEDRKCFVQNLEIVNVNGSIAANAADDSPDADAAAADAR